MVLLVFAGAELMPSETLVGRLSVVVNLGVVVVVLAAGVVDGDLAQRQTHARGVPAR